MKTKLTLLPALALAVIGMTSGTDATARGEDPLVHMAHEIEDIAIELKNEFRSHYRHSGAYRHLMNDIFQVIDEAEHIDELAHDPRASLRHIKADLADLDDLVHHLHKVMDDADRGRYGGHVDGCTRHVRVIVDELNHAIHDMEDYILRIAAAPAPPRHPHPVVSPGPPHYSSCESKGERQARIISGIIGGIIEISRDRNNHHGRHRHH